MEVSINYMESLSKNTSVNNVEGLIVIWKTIASHLLGTDKDSLLKWGITQFYPSVLKGSELGLKIGDFWKDNVNINVNINFFYLNNA